MTFMMKEGEVLKTDVLGRVRTSRERRTVLLDEFERSGVSGRKFAELVGVKYPTFAVWAQQRRRERKQPSLSPSTKPVSQLHWLEAVVEKTGSSAGASVLVVQLPTGARMEVADAGQAALAAAVLRSLENTPRLSC